MILDIKNPVIALNLPLSRNQKVWEQPIKPPPNNPVLILSHWGYGSYLTFDADMIEGAYQIIGFLLSAGLIYYGIRQGLGHVVNTGVTFLVIFIYTKVFDWWWEVLSKYLFFLILAIVAILCLLLMKKIRMKPARAVEGAGR